MDIHRFHLSLDGERWDSFLIDIEGSNTEYIKERLLTLTGAASCAWESVELLDVTHLSAELEVIGPGEPTVEQVKAVLPPGIEVREVKGNDPHVCLPTGMPLKYHDHLAMLLVHAGFEVARYGKDGLPS